VTYYVDLSDMDKRYAEQRIEDFDFVADGQHEAVIHRGSFKAIGQKRERVFEWIFDITSGDYVGCRVQKIAFLRNDDGLKWLKIDMGKCRMKAKTLTEIQQYQQRLSGIPILIKVTTRSDDPNRQNVYIVKRIEEETPEPPPSREEPPPPQEDELPF
jgi:hypothetical protein